MLCKPFRLVLAFFAILPGASSGQAPDAENPLAARSGLSGAQLFSHEWPHLDLKARKAIVDADGSNVYADDESGQLRRSALRRAQRGLSPVVGVGVGDGLGPLHNATSCSACHAEGGAASVDRNVTMITIDPRSKGSTNGGQTAAKSLLEIFPGLLTEAGQMRMELVVHDSSSTKDERYQQIRDKIREHVPGGIPDEWFLREKRTIKAIAERPVVAGRYEAWDFYLSQRNPPPLYGLGLVERIHRNRLQEIADKQAKDTGGQITGRLEGKFGWRGQIASLNAFVGQACAGELGLSHETANQAGDPVYPDYLPPGFDITQEEIHKLVRFVISLPTPREESEDLGRILRGEKHFNNIGCVACHVPDVRPASNVFSDFLLHDMGHRLQAPSPSAIGDTSLLAGSRPVRQLSDTIKGPVSGTIPPYYSGAITGGSFPIAEDIESPDQPQFPRGDRPMEHPKGLTWDDLQREWRTPPLWGLADTGPYLHDGRAETISDAIEWHGGEAQDSADLFVALNDENREDLLRFLKSLRAPDFGNRR